MRQATEDVVTEPATGYRNQVTQSMSSDACRWLLPAKGESLSKPLKKPIVLWLQVCYRAVVAQSLTQLTRTLHKVQAIYLVYYTQSEVIVHYAGWTRRFGHRIWQFPGMHRNCGNFKFWAACAMCLGSELSSWPFMLGNRALFGWMEA